LSEGVSGEEGKSAHGLWASEKKFVVKIRNTTHLERKCRAGTLERRRGSKERRSERNWPFAKVLGSGIKH